ncbi:nucleotide sugar dehydrogenase [Criblamydia sequanensis]|uniref:UDP-N-acetyl-D-mannosamine dehydrogenase n=1 Tax=Candidatus Criblamydia sequanensis CRIB-18 TaxID=1437425 RepID=A0A090D2H4_9BACT|nr:nucleotide sugar dehydrogenase [Criblamydia sequanensis]CDR34353.1 Putative UDP-N-acetyl-D-mannosamine dehydrogenase [Criblamydia sequanensis CRIB-18]
MPLTIDRIHSNECIIGIIGMGYVGFPLALTFVEAGFPVIGFDIDQKKVEAISKGESYFKHIPESRSREVFSKKLLSATSSYEEISKCDAVIICVPTPLDHHLEPDLQYIIQTAEAIAPYLAPNTLVSLESTTWPGTTEEVLLPLLEAKSQRRIGKDLYLCFSPEREDPGNKKYGTKTIPKLVGGVDEESLSLAVALYSKAVLHVVPVSTTRVAELAKLFENIFRSVNIALVNELKLICDPMNIDVFEVIRAAGTKPFGFMPFWPGPGLGGHCIPIDPFYLTWKAKEYGISTRFIELAGEINRSMPKYVVSKVQDCLNYYSKSLKGSRILILGLSYKSDIDDMRESPSLELIHLLEKKGAICDYHDPLVPEIGLSREYNDLAGRISQPLSSNYDCFLLATAHSSFSKDEIMSYAVPIVDTRNFLPKQRLVFTA